MDFIAETIQTWTWVGLNADRRPHRTSSFFHRVDVPDGVIVHVTVPVSNHQNVGLVGDLGRGDCVRQYSVEGRTTSEVPRSHEVQQLIVVNPRGIQAH
jgi:hypothetical protein